MLHPRQVPNLPTDPDMYPLMFPQNVQAQLVESGDWVLYKASPVEDTHIFDILLPSASPPRRESTPSNTNQK